MPVVLLDKREVFHTLFFLSNFSGQVTVTIKKVEAVVFVPLQKVNKFTLEQTTKSQRGSRGIAVLFLTSVLDGGGWSASRPGRFTPGIDS